MEKFFVSKEKSFIGSASDLFFAMTKIVIIHVTRVYLNLADAFAYLVKSTLQNHEY